MLTCSGSNSWCAWTAYKSFVCRPQIPSHIFMVDQNIQTSYSVWKLCRYGHVWCNYEQVSPTPHIYRIGQNRICTPYMTVYMLVPLLKIPYIHRIHTVYTVPAEIPYIHHAHCMYVCMYGPDQTCTPATQSDGLPTRSSDCIPSDFLPTRSSDCILSDCLPARSSDCIPSDCWPACSLDCIPSDCWPARSSDCISSDCWPARSSDCIPSDCLPARSSDCVPSVHSLHGVPCILLSTKRILSSTSAI